MKTLMIERVENGWIVRNFTPNENWACAEVRPIYVYRTIPEICDALPSLLEPYQKPL